MQVNPYLHFNGQCEKAFQLYQQCLGGNIEMMLPYAGTPGEEHVPLDWRNKIMHARLTMGDQLLMGSDAQPEHYKPPQGFSVSFLAKDTQEAERVFNTLAENGKISMPLQQTFWAARFGMLVDQFGIPWMVNCEASQT